MIIKESLGLMDLYEYCSDTVKDILDKLDENDCIEVVEDELTVLYPDGISFTSLHDILRHNTDFIADIAGIEL